MAVGNSRADYERYAIRKNASNLDLELPGEIEGLTEVESSEFLGMQ